MAASGAYRSVIYDFDFTLADSSNGILDCVNTALIAMGAAPAERDAVNATIGLPLAETYSILTGRSDQALCTEFAERFHRRADIVMVDSTSVYAFVPDAMRSVRR